MTCAIPPVKLYALSIAPHHVREDRKADAYHVTAHVRVIVATFVLQAVAQLVTSPAKELQVSIAYLNKSI